MWQATLAKFDLDVAAGLIARNGDLFEVRLLDGRTKQMHSLEVKQWRLRVERLATEADKRMEAKDWAWFAWIDEYASMKSETLLEDFGERYDGLIETGAKAKSSIKKRSDAGAAARRTIGKRTGEIVKKAKEQGKSPPVSERHERRLRNKK